MAMAAPILAVVSLAATVAGGVMQYQAAQQQAQAQADAARYQAEVANANRKVNEQNAAYERQKGDVDAMNQDLKNAGQQGKVLAGLAANGFDVNTGTNLGIQESTEKLGRLDTLTTRNNAERKAYAYDVAAKNDESTAGLYEMQAANAEKAGSLNAFTSLIGTASSFGDKWMSYKNQGVFG